MRSVGIGAARPAASRQSGPARPARMATGIPARMPLNDVSGVLKSPWASTQTTPIATPAPAACCRPETTPMAAVSSPARTSAPSPLRRAAATRRAVSAPRRPMLSAVRPSSRLAGSRWASCGPVTSIPAARRRSAKPAASERVRAGAKTFATLVIPVGNGYQINPHGSAPAGTR